MIGDTVKLKTSALKMFEQYKDNPAVIVIVATYLVNNKEYTLAEDIINEGLKIAPNDFDLNQQMTYRFFYEAVDWDNICEDLKSKRKFTPALEALNKANEILESALIWAEKSYNIKQEDKLHNIMYQKILVRLQKTVPDELKAKVDSYYQKQ
jgi:tetratricopeptide (TPR) repeat protein